MMNLSSDALTTLVGVLADISAMQRKALLTVGVVFDVDLCMNGRTVDISVTVQVDPSLEVKGAVVEPTV